MYQWWIGQGLCELQRCLVMFTTQCSTLFLAMTQKGAVAAMCTQRCSLGVLAGGSVHVVSFLKGDLNAQRI
jgi:hypothetical protein